MKCCEGQDGTIIYIRALQGHSHGVAIHPNLFQTDTVELDGTRISHVQLFQLLTAIVNPFFSSMTKRAAELFTASASARQKPRPPDHKAGGRPQA